MGMGTPISARMEVVNWPTGVYLRFIWDEHLGFGGSIQSILLTKTATL
jgi:hypothetical protein